MLIFLKIVQIAIAVTLSVAAIYLRSPLLASVRSWLLWVVVAIAFIFIVSECLFLKKIQLKFPNLLSFFVLAVAAFSFTVTAVSEVNFQLTKSSVLNAEPSQLEKLGQHFIIGYRSRSEIESLVKKNAIAGIFITRRNITNKTKAEIQQEIASFQTIRRNSNLPPLFIATDQEGGIVSRLSPPLTKLPQLSQIVTENPQIEAQKPEVIAYASQQARELAELGINLNFAPVVDINKQIINPKDKYSLIYKRAISADKNIVAQVGLWYCQTLESFNVKCTIKHFPGLGRVDTDTHLNEAELTTTIAELSQDDWVPFQKIIENSQAFTMLGHAKLTAVDTQHPVSFSQAVINGIIRKDWQHNGVLITDDFSMWAVFGSQDGIKKATIKSLNAGVDLILIAYDTDLYYPAMSALLKADTAGKLDNDLLAKSRQRLVSQLPKN
ncbi:MAG: glycoside hydrolase family 3 N-terminal domain-containing protein [Oscillatoria sp. PMC 1051.18]|nr:glycoside hydrolase family 3 N-terminal domain-containing protein [Oscillatoria sp. PMC 1050.18]MEC5030844.1 glycoside hydrolase family 3 N-terminal domain-containing protein [Oscillatoria sp. PMC 1051.18]